MNLYCRLLPPMAIRILEQWLHLTGSAAVRSTIFHLTPLIFKLKDVCQEVANRATNGSMNQFVYGRIVGLMTD